MTNNDAANRNDKPSINTKLHEKQRKMLILCDIYGKTLADSIKNNNTEFGSVLSICRPRAPLKEIVKAIATLADTLSEGDDMIVIASDINQYKIENVRYVRDVCNSKKLKFQISTIPYLKPSLKHVKINENIFNMNLQLHNLANHSTGMKIIEINHYNRKYFKCKDTIAADFIEYLRNRIIQNSTYEYTYKYNNLITLTNTTAYKDCSMNKNFESISDSNAGAINNNAMNVTTHYSNDFLDRPLLQMTMT